MDKAIRYLGQAFFYAVFFVPVVYITQQPTHRHLEENMAELKIAIRHAGAIIGECVPIHAGAAENVGRPVNMQRAEICPRERSPLQLALVLDGDTLYSASIPASGLHNDGISSMYQRFTIPAGKHTVQLLMNDDVAVTGYNWQLEEDVQLQPAQIMVANFKEGFRLR